MANNKSLKNHLALVTGAAGGIGLEFSKVLAARGADLIILDLNLQRLQKARDEILLNCKQEADPSIFLLQADLTDPDFLGKIDDYCTQNSLNPDILINNAGIFSFNPIDTTDSKLIETFIDLHVRAVTLLSRWFTTRRKGEGNGWMLNMSSMSCWMPMPGLAMYASTKSYIRVFTRSLHYEMKDYGVGVTVACPGGIATDLFGLPQKWKRFAVAIGVLQTPEAFASKAIGKMMKKRKQYINGWLNRVSIFFVGILPTKIRMMVKHQMLDKGIAR
ncbi:MAG: SDR family NAD(P)-dependent oxidoreductase [Muribaculaceae bacterium]|nr:SDR family NAD(P)-dependent oxidoreductase [Muribaculaceae bacterium]